MGPVIFTDLDGTLLDNKTYSFYPATEALDKIKRLDVPLIFCTSKTRAETTVLWQKIGLSHPFIVESGQAIVCPKNYFPQVPENSRQVDNLIMIVLGADYFEILKAINHIKKQVGHVLVGFNDMSVEDVARETGLSIDGARLAKQREFDEPFKILQEPHRYEPVIIRIAQSFGLRCIRSGRFYHLHGKSDKGKAVRFLCDLLAKKLGELKTVGLGDSAMDLHMLLEVDVTVIIPKDDGSYDGVLLKELPFAKRAPLPGPAGWNRVVLELLEQI